MKTLALGSLFAVLATGCVIHDDRYGYEDDDYDDYGDATITGEWQFRDLATDRTTGCPAGFGTVRLVSQPIDARLAPVGEPFIDLFDCVDGRHASALLPPDVYQVWLEIVTDSGTGTYAQSTSKYVDVIERDATFSAEILNDGGYFMFDWQLRGEQSNQALNCAGADSIEILSTLAGSTEAVGDRFRCDDGLGLTAGLLNGAYTISVSALDSSDRAIGIAPTQTSKAIRDRNQITDLGSISIPIEGL